MFLKKALMTTRRIGRSMSDFPNPNLVRTDFKNGIKQITMTDPKTRNSLSVAMMETLIEHIKKDEHNPELRVIVLSGEGPAFSGGHNLKELASNKTQQEACFTFAYKLMNTLIDSPVPIIAKVDGIAAAAGCQLVAQCDISICSDQSKFSTPGANFGLFCSTPGVALARSINKMPALYMLFTGLPISAEEAKSFGLVSKVYSGDQLDDEVGVICETIKAKSRDVIELGKRFYYKQVECDVRKAYQLGCEKMLENLQIGDCREGIRSFIEKRKPQWGANN